MYVNLESHKRNENNQALYDTTYRQQTQDIQSSVEYPLNQFDYVNSCDVRSTHMLNPI